LKNIFLIGNILRFMAPPSTDIPAGEHQNAPPYDSVLKPIAKTGFKRVIRPDVRV
jgi:hypothetical protein